MIYKKKINKGLALLRRTTTTYTQGHLDYISEEQKQNKKVDKGCLHIVRTKPEIKG